jgi:hypothetical protein
MFYSKAPQEFEILDDMPKEKKHRKNERGIIVIIIIISNTISLTREMKKVTRNKLLFLKNFLMQL